MIKNIFIKTILVSIFFSSLISIYRQILIIRTAQSSVLQLEEKMKKIEARNNALQQALK